MRRFIGKIISAACIAALLLTNWNAQASSGDLDTDFGREGKVTTDFFGDNDESLGLIVQPDGKAVVAGFARRDNRLTFVAISRYNPDGSLDSSFGEGGRATMDSFAGFTSGNAFALQPDGKLLVGGSELLGGTVIGFALVRLNEDGSLDKSFGANGKSVAALTDGRAAVKALRILSDGKILAAGTANSVATSHNDFAVARFNTDGSLDTTFGIDGRVITDFLGSRDFVGDMAIQTDGRIVVSGIAQDPVSGSKFVLARYNSDGSPDAEFGSGGKVITLIGEGTREAEAIALQPDGKIIVGGAAYRQRSSSVITRSIVAPPNEDLALVRYNEDGSLDSSFGEAGLMLRDIGVIDRIKDISIQPDDKIIVVGYTSGKSDSDFPLDWDMVLSRYDSDGSLEIDFESAESPDAPLQYSYGSGLFLQADKITVAGSISTRIGNNDFLLLRYNAGEIIARPDFTLAAHPVVNASRGEKVEIAIDINRFNDFAGNVTVSAPDTKALKIKINKPSVSTAGDRVSFRLKIKPSAPTGDHQLVFTGRDDAGKERIIKIRLAIR
jgi:uncharacterized delta-60 repeat protein